MNAKKFYPSFEGAMPENLGERIDLFLKIKNISRAEFGRECGTSGTTSVTNYIDGKSKPNTDFVTLAAKKFDLNPTWLLFGQGPMLLSQADPACLPEPVQPPGPTQDEQLVELKHRLAEQILAGVEMRDRHSRWLHRALAAIAKTAKTYGMTTDQHQAVMDAVLDPDEAMAKLAELEAATVHQAAAGE